MIIISDRTRGLQKTFGRKVADKMVYYYLVLRRTQRIFARIGRGAQLECSKATGIHRTEVSRVLTGHRISIPLLAVLYQWGHEYNYGGLKSGNVFPEGW